MRIIISIALLLMIGLGVSSAQNVVLNGVVGQSVAFPDAVKISGTLIHKNDGPQTIGDVKDGQFTDFTEGRVQWNSSTGLFSIAGLKLNDSGMYALLNNDAERRKLYQYQMDANAPVELTTPPSPKTSPKTSPPVELTTPPSPMTSRADPLKPVGMFSIVNCVLVVCAVLGYLG
ncbi:hypothetical protein AAFF_G00365000 [Aldrovandia affinis]|uniref:Uncharacterized protein n=1 Tax=Aldrovandia affinis TaxID=143900 RepID=A0AAD7VZD1_9TELE|nr:hypothetical protein AAFF_G00365000 [Aldrovandia affinis]